MGKLRAGVAGYLRAKADRSRLETYGRREHELRSLPIPRDEALPLLRKTTFWQLGEMSLAFADVLDGIADVVGGKVGGRERT